MKCLLLLIIIFIICSELEISLCFDEAGNERLLKEEVADFADYLRQKHSASGSRFGSEISPKNPRDENGYLDSYHGDGRRRGDPDFDNFPEDLIHENPNSNVEDSGQILSPKRSLSSAIVSNPEKSTSEAVAKRYGVDEFVYFKRSDSDFNDPVPEMIERLVNDQPAVDPSRDVQFHTGIEKHDEFHAVQDASAVSTCPVEKIASRQDQTCPNGPEYEMEIPPGLSEALKHQMLQMLPDNNEEKCNIWRHFGPKTGVEDRALCPFQINITNRNRYRVPEYLYEANCSCTVPNVPNFRLRQNPSTCVQVKRPIPVLWLVSCDNEKKRYKQGWEYIAVSCAPREERMGHSIDLAPTA